MYHLPLANPVSQQSGSFRQPSQLVGQSLQPVGQPLQLAPVQPRNQSSFPNPVTLPQSVVPSSLLPPPLNTPPKLLSVDDVMRDYPGNAIFTLRRLTTALARDAIFGKEALRRSSLSGKNNTGCLEKRKLECIIALVRSLVPTVADITFEAIWAKCRSLLSKSCQTLRVTAKKKILS